MGCRSSFCPMFCRLAWRASRFHNDEHSGGAGFDGFFRSFGGTGSTGLGRCRRGGGHFPANVLPRAVRLAVRLRGGCHRDAPGPPRFQNSKKFEDDFNAGSARRQRGGRAAGAPARARCHARRNRSALGATPSAIHTPTRDARARTDAKRWRRCWGRHDRRSTCAFHWHPICAVLVPVVVHILDQNWTTFRSII